jgi:signal transduction histidine kinase
MGLVTYLGLPITVREEVVGVLTFNTTAPREYGPGELAYLASYADQAAIAIENARLYSTVQQHAAELETRVRERTQELAGANQQLQDASRHKSEFLANMSHELRTPLNAIIGFADLLQDQRVGALNEKQARYITHVVNGGKHLRQLIGDILDLSKVEAGKFILQPEPLPVAQTLEDILVIARGLAHKKAQKIHADIAADLPSLVADPVRFKQILFNLLSNAVKFTPNGGRITLTARRVDWSNSQLVDSARRLDQLTTRPIDIPGEWLEIRVTDTGIGIKTDDLPRLFRDFVQLETTQAQNHEGTGLGLALSKRLVELHGGRIWAESEGERRGSTFTVLLPFAGPGEDREH